MRRSSRVINLTEFGGFYNNAVTTRPTPQLLRADLILSNRHAVN